MDVADLAPALLGMSELCKIANRKFNGDRAAIKVLIGTDIEHQCFQFSLDIVQTIWQQAAVLVGHEDIKSAKEILSWLGMGVGVVGSTVFGLFKLLKWLNGRKITETKFEVKDGKNVVLIKVEGDNNTFAIAHPQAVELLNDPVAIANAKKVVQPLTKDGYDKLEFESQNKITERISKEEAEVIVEEYSDYVLETPIDGPQQITAWIQVYSPVYATDAPTWQFKFSGRHERMDISETDIAAKALARGGALIDDTYKVILEIQQTKTPSGKFSVKYKIKEVLEFHPAKMRSQDDWISEPADIKDPPP